MDAAVIQIKENEWHGGVEIAPSSVFGFKPIELVSSSGILQGWVKELGIPKVFGIPGEEPYAANLLIVDRTGSRGDSGCIIRDIERVDAPRPYLLYVGITELSGLEAGIGLLLEQPRLIWDLKFHC
jgi:hypothetical protein